MTIEESNEECVNDKWETRFGKRKMKLKEVGFERRSILQIVESVEHLYDGLGEERLLSLAIANRLIS